MKYLECNPSDFCEAYLGIKLNKWQKLIIDTIKQNEKLIINYPNRNGRTMTVIMLKILNKEKLNDMELKWCKKILSKEVYQDLLDNNQHL